MKFKPVNLTLGIWQITIILLYVLPFMMLQYFNSSYFKEIQSNYSKQRLEDIAKKAQAQLLFPVVSTDQKAIEVIVNDLMTDSEIRSIQIKDTSGNTLYYRESDSFAKDDRSTLYRKVVELVDKRPLLDSGPFGEGDIENSSNGSVVLYLTTNKYDDQVSQQLDNHFYLISGLILLIASISYLVTRKGHKQALSITSHIQSLLKGDYSHEEKLGSVVEFNQISTGLNQLGSKLDQKINDLEKSEQAALDGISALQKAAYFKDEFIHIISHEIRTPVNTITNLINILETHLTESNINQIGLTHYHVCKDATVDLRNLVDELVDFDKLERTNIEISLNECDVTEFFTSIYRQNHDKFKQKSLTFKVENTSDSNDIGTKLVYLDSVKLKQVINNLLDNAFKYTESGAVTLQWSINVAEDGGCDLEVTCKDSGIGIPDESLENIFEPFYQVQKKRVYAYTGYGLGLSIVKKLIEAMHGKLDVSTKVGIGSTFSFSVSVQQVNNPVTKALPASQPSQQEMTEYTITSAVIDDDKNNGYTMAAMLENVGIPCRQYTNPNRAIDELIADPVDLILIDLHMSEMDGIQTAKKLRDGITGLNATLICVTADTHKTVSEMIGTSVMDGLIYKPIHIEELIKIINSVESSKKIAQGIMF